MTEELDSAIKSLEMLSEDGIIPKNVKAKLIEIIKSLKSGADLSLSVNKALADLDDISNDTNIPQFNRTTVWEIISLLEKCA